MSGVVTDAVPSDEGTATEKLTQADFIAQARVSRWIKDTVFPNPFKQGTPARKRLRATRRNVLPHRP